MLAIQYKTARDSPILVAENREESYDRPTQSARIQAGRPRVICGIDKKSWRDMARGQPVWLVCGGGQQTEAGGPAGTPIARTPLPRPSGFRNGDQGGRLL